MDIKEIQEKMEKTINVTNKTLPPTAQVKPMPQFSTRYLSIITEHKHLLRNFPIYRFPRQGLLSYNLMMPLC